MPGSTTTVLERSFDAAFINAVTNDPTIRPWVGAPELGELDMSGLVADHNQWWLIGEHGGFMLMWSAPGVREVHTFVLPEGRGAWARQARTDMLDYARENGTKLLWTRIPPEAPHVKAFAMGGGMVATGEVVETLGQPYDVYSVELA